MIDIRTVDKAYDDSIEALEKEGVSQKKVQDDLMEEFKKQRCLLKGAPIPSFIKPVFVGPEEIVEYRQVTEVIMRALEKVSNLFYTDASMEPLFQMRPGEGEITKVDHGYDGRIQHARLDAFVHDGVVRFCEFNCDTPGGPGWLDWMSESLLQIPSMKRLGEQYTLSFEALMPGVLDGLLTCYRQWCERKGKTPQEKPTIGVTTIPHLDPTNDEITNIGVWLNNHGHDGVVASAKDCSYENGVLTIEGRPVELMYRRGAGFWWLDHPDDYGAIKRAYGEGNLCLVNPVSSKLGGKKSLMAVLQSDAMKDILTDEEHDAVAKHIPWTRLVEETETTYQGQTVGLVPFILENRENMVLKPIGLFGGKDVVVGRDADDETWKATLDKALAEKYVVQEYIPIPTIRLPVVDDEGIHFHEKKINMNFYAFNGKYAGGLARVSDSSVINVCAGGGVIPIITVAEK